MTIVAEPGVLRPVDPEQPAQFIATGPSVDMFNLKAAEDKPCVSQPGGAIKIIAYYNLHLTEPVLGEKPAAICNNDHDNNADLPSATDGYQLLPADNIPNVQENCMDTLYYHGFIHLTTAEKSERKKKRRSSMITLLNNQIISKTELLQRNGLDTATTTQPNRHCCSCCNIL